MCNSYTNLHLHTHYSSDGMIKPNDLIEYLEEIGEHAVAITDHGTLAGIANMFHAYDEYKQNGGQHDLKIISGCEFYLYYQDKHDDPGVPVNNHITILALNQNGFSNLVRLNNAAHENTMNLRPSPRPLMTLDMLDSYRQDLVVLSGCPLSALFNGDHGYGVEYVEQLARICGKENVFLEVMFSMPEPKYYIRPMQISEELSIPYVFTTDSHFLRKEHAEIHPVQVRARKGFDYDSPDLFVHSYQQLKETSLEYVSQTEFNSAIETIKTIVDRAEPIVLKNEPILPEIDHAEQTLLELLITALGNDFTRYPDEIENRLERFHIEWNVITDKGFYEYFYILNDIIYFCRKNNIKYNVRGSAAGCYLLYLLEISPLDPIKHNLLFERFLNAARKDFPDVDLDVDKFRRNEIQEYAKEKWSMVGVSTYSEYHHNSLVRDLCRVLNLPKEWGEQLCNDGIDSPLMMKVDEREPLFRESYDVMLEQIKNRGTHAGAICSANVQDLPLEQFNSTEPLIAYSKDDLEFVGGVKLDLLALKELAKHAEMERLTGAVPPSDPEDFPQEVFDTINAGLVTDIFQLDGSPKIKEFMLNFGIDQFEDLALVSALARPGVIQAFSEKQILDAKINPIMYKCDVDDYLYKNYGIMIYQENVMEIYAAITGGGLQDADNARKILCPKKPGLYEKDPTYARKFDEYKNYFFTKGVENDYTQEVLELLWDNIKAFAGYGFNKCLTGDTVIYRASANQYVDRELTIAELYNDLQTRHGSAWRKKFYGKNQGMKILSFDEDKQRVVPNRIIDVYYQGVAPVYRITLEDGNTITSTNNHKHYTIDGYKQVRDITVDDYLLVNQWYEESNYSYSCTVGDRQKNGTVNNAYGEDNYGFVDGGFAKFNKYRKNASSQCQHCGEYPDRIEIAHLDGDRTNNEDDNLLELCVSCHKKYDYENNNRTKKLQKGYPVKPVRIVSIEYIGEQDVYDIEMETPMHCFIANNIVTHNSHAYSYAWLGLIDAWYRTFYPVEYYTALLKVEAKDGGSDSKASVYVHEAIKLGMKVERPHINISTDSYEQHDGIIYLPLTAIKGFGDKSLEMVLETRERLGGKFDSYEQVMEELSGRHFNVGTRERLWKVSGFNGLSGDEQALQLREYTGKDTIAAETDAMGFFLPSDKFIQRVEEINSHKNRFAGTIIKKSKGKTKVKGVPNVWYGLSPSGGFKMYTNSDDFEELEKGTYVEVRVNNWGYAKPEDVRVVTLKRAKQ